MLKGQRGQRERKELGRGKRKTPFSGDPERYVCLVSAMLLMALHREGVETSNTVDRLTSTESKDGYSLPGVTSFRKNLYPMIRLFHPSIH